MSRLDAVLKVRMEPDLRAELDDRAVRSERTAAALARRYIREGLKRDASPGREADRGK